MGANDRLYVSDAYNNRVVAYSTEGKFLFQFGSIRFLDGSFRVSSSIASDKQGHLYVVDFYNHRVQKFTEDGSFLTQWGGKGAVQFDGPTDVAVGPQG